MTDIVHCLNAIVEACPRQGLRFMADTIVAILVDVLVPDKGNQVVAPFLALVVSPLLIRCPEEVLRLFEYACNTRGPEVAAALQRLEAGAADPHVTRPPCERLLASFLGLWLDKFDSIASKGMRKMASLGLCALLKLDVPCVVPRFGEIVTHVAAVWAEVEQGPDADTLGLSFANAGAGPRDDFIPVSVDLEEAEGETARRQALYSESPVVALLIKDYFQECMRQSRNCETLVQAAGGSGSEDGSIAKMLDELLI
jgi:hypothetical protein